MANNIGVKRLLKDTAPILGSRREGNADQGSTPPRFGLILLAKVKGHEQNWCRDRGPIYVFEGEKVIRQSPAVAPA